jgi:hypothetical protein
MAILKRPSRNDNPDGEHDVHRWAAELPAHAKVHVREKTGYVGSFLAHEVQDDTLVEEHLISAFGPGTYDLVAQSDGVFLAERHTLHIGSRTDRQEAQRQQAVQEGHPQAELISNLENTLGLFQRLGVIPTEADRQAKDDLTNTLVQGAVQYLRPPDPTESLGHAFDFIKQVRELEPPRPAQLPPGKRRRRKPGKSATEKKNEAIADFLGTAVVVGTNMAMQNPATVQKVKDGVASTASRVGGWIRGRAGAADAPHPNRADEAKPVSLEDAIASVRALARTPIGGRLLDRARAAMPALTPQELVTRGLDGAREWLGEGHPLLAQTRTDPGRVFDEVADIVGLANELRIQARVYFLDMMARNQPGAAAQPPDETERPAPESGDDQNAGDGG